MIFFAGVSRSFTHFTKTTDITSDGIKEFVTKAILAIVEGVDAAHFLEDREVHLIELGDSQKIMFDVAIAVDGAAFVKGQGSRTDVVVVAAGPGRHAGAATDSSGFTRVQFGVHVDRPTPEQIQQKIEMLRAWRKSQRHR